jgi:sRNA-binding protein
VFCTNIPKPLKLGIHDDLVAKYGPDNGRLSQWLKFWTSRREYLFRVAYGKHRHNLDGEDVEEIADRDRTYSKIRIHEVWLTAVRQRQRRHDEGEE